MPRDALRTMLFSVFQFMLFICFIDYHIVCSLATLLYFHIWRSTPQITSVFQSGEFGWLCLFFQLFLEVIYAFAKVSELFFTPD